VGVQGEGEDTSQCMVLSLPLVGLVSIASPGGCGVAPLFSLPGARHDAARPASAQMEGSPIATKV
jgi:hypothetical protein